MKKIIIAILFTTLVIAGCKSEKKNNNDLAYLLLLTRIGPSSQSQIIADHTIVADFDKIPAEYMAEVKKMMVAFPGESHSEAYRVGMELLEAQYPDYACNVSGGENSTDQYVRVKSDTCGEAQWFTWYAWDDHEDGSGNKDFIRNLIREYENDGNPIHAIGFGWCWDMSWTNDVTPAKDPVYGCGWAGSSEGGPDGNLPWGLDSGDFDITGNRVSLDTYLEATQAYIDFCSAMSYSTRVVFTTGPVDNYAGENGYQTYLKQQRIRDYVKGNTSRILFDYADILCYDDGASEPNTASWNGNTYPVITAANAGDGSIGHIGEAGAIRLAKAQWWMLARIAGWNGK